ncbi:MAG: hypothetical protein M1814_001997 [Vezdaea aestivalis]|nr:MAG: hypothetical protein M1814_001997 [Vezdaea aestivalis]
MSSRRSEFWVPGDGITREVIQSEICRHLGNDALVRPGNQNGTRGYIITAMRPLTSAQLEDIRRQSESYGRETSVRTNYGVGALPYDQSATNARQAVTGYGGGYPPTDPYGDGRQSNAAAGPYPGYPPQASPYGAAPPTAYGQTGGPGYNPPPNTGYPSYRQDGQPNPSYPTAGNYQGYSGYQANRPAPSQEVPRTYEPPAAGGAYSTARPGQSGAAGYEPTDYEFDRTRNQWVKKNASY